MELTLTNVTYRHHPHPLSLLHHHRSSFGKSISFPKSTSFPPLTPIKASFRNPNFETPKPQITKTLNLNPNPLSLSFLKTTFIAGVTITALFLSHFSVRLAIAAPDSPPPPPPTVETADPVSNHDEEKALEDHLCSHPQDTKALKSLMELKIKIGKVHEAIAILNQLMDLEPEDNEWQLLKNHLHAYGGDHELAKLGFEEILSKNPFRVEAYHGLVMAASAKESIEELQDVESRILQGMEMCKKEKKKDDLRDFKLLLAQIRVIQNDYNEAIKIYQDLCKEEPRDFRPYLCQGIIYQLLGKNDEAEKNFEKYRRLVPKGHPYTKFFDDNMMATKVFAEKLERERAYSKS